MVAKRVYKGCPISLPNRVTLVDLIELDMLDFDIMLGMDWFHACFASIDCRLKVVKFQIPNQPILSGREETQILREIDCRGLFYHIVRVRYLES